MSRIDDEITKKHLEKLCKLVNGKIKDIDWEKYAKGSTMVSKHGTRVGRQRIFLTASQSRRCVIGKDGVFMSDETTKPEVFETVNNLLQQRTYAKPFWSNIGSPDSIRHTYQYNELARDFKKEVADCLINGTDAEKEKAKKINKIIGA